MILEQTFQKGGAFTRFDGGRILNVHERLVAGAPADSEAILESLTEPGSAWPGDRWPALRLDDGLRIGSQGGHGPIRYAVIEHERGRRVRFAFARGSGMDGWHELRLDALPGLGVHWTHELVLVHPGFLVRHVAVPLHDALIEDLLDGVAAALGGVDPRRRPLTSSVLWRRRVLQGLRPAR